MPQTPSRQAVEEQLERVLASPDFARSERLGRLLRYLVAETLAGRGGQIKEYTLGLEVYERQPDYDPKIDATVRVEAGRLRAKLKHFYETDGKASPLRLELPKGAYIPVFKVAAAAGEPGRPDQPRAPRRAILLGVGLAVVAVIAYLVIQGTPAASKGVRQGLISIAVLPFMNMSGDPEMERFADGMTEQVTHRLASVEGFLVPARTTAFQFRGKALDVASIGRQLKMAAVLEGSVQRSERKMRATAQLVESSDGIHLWSETYEASSEHPLDFQARVSEAIARTLQRRFAGLSANRLARRGSSNPQALRLYLKGQEEWETQRRAGQLKSLEYYQKAIALDPDYAEAYAGVAASELLLAYIDQAPERASRAKAAALRAMALNDRIADPHARLGNIYLYNEWDFGAAERELRRSLELQPGPDAVERWYALAAALRGHFDAAIPELELGRMVNPTAEKILTALGTLYLYLGRYEEAAGLARQALAIAPHDRLSNLLLGLVEEQQGRYGEAKAHFLVCTAGPKEVFHCRAAFGHACAVSGDRKEAERILRELGEGEPLSTGIIYAGLGETARALDSFEKGFTLREPDIPFIKVDPRLRQLRPDPRFRSLLARMGL